MDIIRKLCGLLVGCLVSPALGADVPSDDSALTFFGWSDQHVQTDGDAAHLLPAIDAMNKLPGTPFPNGIEGEVAEPAFVFGCGDITEWPTNAAMKAYDQLITKRLKFPAYDILGNHDEGGKEPSETMRKWIISRHGAQSYTFEHGGVHFIALFSKYDESLNHPAQPLTDEAFDFLRSSLSEMPAGSPVIVATHLCFDAITNRDALCDVLGDANVIAILGGHYHKAKVDKYRGRQFLQLPSPAPGSSDEVTVVRITSDRLLAIPYDYRRGKWSDDPKKRLNVEIRGPTAAELDLTDGWRFKIGDHDSWSDLALDDSSWQPIRVGAPWEKQGFEDYDGLGWYRLHFRAPERLRDDPTVQKFQLLRLALGKIDDVDQAWVNGKLVGSTGSLADPYEAAWFTPRVYPVPVSTILWNEDNVLAVRVYDGDGVGGMYEGVCRLSAPTEEDFLRIDFELGRADGIFADEGGLTVAAKLSNASPTEVAGNTQWEIKDDEGKTVTTADVSTVIPGQGETHVTNSFQPGMPGFYRITCEFRSESMEGVKSSITLGYRPEEIKAAVTAQKDFAEFWSEALENLADVKPQFQMTRHAEMDSDTHEVYEVEMRSLGNVRVRGWYERPLAAGRFPAMLRVPGYSGNMKPTGSKESMAILSFNIRGHGNSQDDVPGDPNDYWIRGLDQKQEYFYLGAYADCVRAVDFLVSRPEVDRGRIVVTGGSQGGGLSLATAALDPRISLCAPDIPFLCDWVKYFKASDWPEMNTWVEAEPHRSWPTTLRTLSYFDTLNLADRIRCPVFLGVGLQDDVCPAATIFAVFNRLHGPKEYHVYPKARHAVGASHDQKRRDWIRKHFQMNP